MCPSVSESLDYLRRLGEAGEGPHDIAGAALMLSALDHGGRALAPYRAHLDEIARTCRESLRLICRVEDAGEALAAQIAGRFGYEGDRLAYDDPRNADLMSVIDRRRGLPVTLGILYIHGARAGGLQARGLNTPHHFLLELAFKGGMALIDPFNGGALIERERLGQPFSDADVLLRLQHDIKSRAHSTGDHARAKEIAGRMVLIAPSRAELWIDLAHMEEAGGALGAAKAAYETCLNLAQAGAPLHNEAAVALSVLKRRLN